MTEVTHPSRIGGSGAGFIERSISVGDSTLRWWESGSGTPIVHVQGGTGPELTGAHDALAAAFRVLVPEIPGFGAAPMIDSIASPRDMATLLWRWLDAAGIDRVIVMGSSLGGGVAMWMAIDRPTRVEALVLEAPSALRPEGLVEERIPPDEIPSRAFADPQRMLQLMPQVSPERRRPPSPMMPRLIGPKHNPELEAALQSLSLPVLLAFGAQDGIVSPAVGRVYRRLLPNLEFVLIIGAAHAVQEEQPAAFAAVVRQFLSGEAVFAGRQADLVVVPQPEGEQ